MENGQSLLIILNFHNTWQKLDPVWIILNIVRIGSKNIQKAVHQVWQYRLWSFQGRNAKSEKFLAKNQTNCRNYQIWRCQKLPNLTFKVNFLSQKSSESLWFFLLKNTNLEAHFLLLTFFDNVNSSPLLQCL